MPMVTARGEGRLPRPGKQGRCIMQSADAFMQSAIRPRRPSPALGSADSGFWGSCPCLKYSNLGALVRGHVGLGVATHGPCCRQTNTRTETEHLCHLLVPPGHCRSTSRRLWQRSSPSLCSLRRPPRARSSCCPRPPLLTLLQRLLMPSTPAAQHTPAQTRRTAQHLTCTACHRQAALWQPRLPFQLLVLWRAGHQQP